MKITIKDIAQKLNLGIPGRKHDRYRIVMSRIAVNNNSSLVTHFVILPFCLIQQTIFMYQPSLINRFVLAGRYCHMIKRFVNISLCFSDDYTNFI